MTSSHILARHSIEHRLMKFRGVSTRISRSKFSIKFRFDGEVSESFWKIKFRILATKTAKLPIWTSVCARKTLPLLDKVFTD